MPAIDWTPIIKQYPGEWVGLDKDERTVLAHHKSLKVLKHIVDSQNLDVIYLKVPVKVELSGGAGLMAYQPHELEWE